jgi:glycosyltransferase involved in cell wall biosynthesis
MCGDAVLLSIVVPAFNEEHTVGNIINRLQLTLKKTGLPNEIIVIDDHSNDRTIEESLKQKATVYSFKQHMGKGYALRAGFTKVKGDIIVTIDSDGSNQPEELLLLLQPILENKTDLVIGSRFAGKEGTPGKKFNAAGVRLFNSVIKLLTGATVSDSQSGYRVMKRVVLEGLNLKSGTYEIESEMLVKIARKKFRVCEVPISFEQRTYGVSRLDPIVDGLKIFLSIFTSYLRV